MSEVKCTNCGYDLTDSNRVKGMLYMPQGFSNGDVLITVCDKCDHSGNKSVSLWRYFNLKEEEE